MNISDLLSNILNNTEEHKIEVEISNKNENSKRNIN